MMITAFGCQSRLNIDRSYKVDAGASQTVIIDPPRYEQKVAVTVTADAAVTVNVYLKTDSAAVEKDLNNGKKSDKVLATWTGDGTGTLEAKVPGHQEAVVRIDAPTKPANVTLKIVNK
jgi:hypothetical protein